MKIYLNPVRCTGEQAYEIKVIMQCTCANDDKGMYRQEIDMTNIKPNNTIVSLIHELNQEGIDIYSYCGTSGERKDSSNGAEDNLKSSTEAGNNNINTQTNKMVVDNVIPRQASR